jgi:hypothetical protein
MRKLRFIFIFALIFSSKLYAVVDFEDAVFPELATSSRALAMGNAFVAKADDSSAVFYNPAGLGTVRYPHLHLSNFTIETNKDGMSAASAGSGLSTLPNLISMFSIDGTRKVLLANPGKFSHSRLHALPNFTSRYFSMGYLVAKRTRAVVSDATSATGFEFADRTDHGPYAAINLSLFGGVFKVGASAIFLNRSELTGTIDPRVTFDETAHPYYKGSAIIITTGGKITLPIVMLPTFAATLHNSGNNKFSGRGSAGAPNDIAQSLDAGFSLTPQLSTSSRIHLEINYKDLTNQFSNVSATRKLLLGMEFDIMRVFFFRLGYGDGFGSAGLGIKSRMAEFDLTTYAVDTSSAAFRGSEDRRFAIGISSGF